MIPPRTYSSGFSTAAIAVAAFFSLVVLARATVPLVDGDVWWHLRAGEEVLRSGTVPATDTWSIAGQGMPWTSQDWLSNTLMAAVVRLGGDWGPTLLSLLFALAVTGTFGLFWAAVARRRGDAAWLWGILLFTAGLIVAGPVVGVRVQTVDLVLAAFTVLVLWSYLVAPRPLTLVALPIIAVIWVNSHAGFLMLFLLGGAVAVGEAVDRAMARALRTPVLAWADTARLAIALAVCAMVLVVNPNGVAIYAYPFETSSIGAHRDFIFEWSRPDLTSFLGQVLFAFTLAVVIPTLWLSRREIRTADALWLIGLTAMSLVAIRFALFIGPIGAAIAAVHAPSHPAGGLPQRMTRAPAASRLQFLNAGLVALVMLAGATFALTRAAPSVQATAIAEAMPVEAALWLENHDEPRRIFNVYAWGGYLGRELPDSLVYIDGRSDIYGDAPIREYARAIALEIDPAALLDRSRIDAVVFWPNSPLADWLNRQPSWTHAYEDEQAAVWVRATTE